MIKFQHLWIVLSRLFPAFLLSLYIEISLDNRGKTPYLNEESRLLLPDFDAIINQKFTLETCPILTIMPKLPRCLYLITRKSQSADN